MQLHAELTASEDNQPKFTVSVPPTRSDVLHPCDVAEDLAIAYGYNAIPKTTPASVKPLPLNELSELIRIEIAMAGFTEVLTFILCSYKENFTMLNRKCDKSTAVIIGNPRSADFENFTMLNRKGDKSTAVIIGNPRSADFEVVRTSLMSGILKTARHNKDHAKPIKIFEVGDIVLLDNASEVGAVNRHQVAALYCGATSGFELIHGLVDRTMEVNGTPFVSTGDTSGYYIEKSSEPEFVPGRQASLIYKGEQIGKYGIVHPEVLKNFDIPDPCSFVELNLNAFL